MRLIFGKVICIGCISLGVFSCLVAIYKIAMKHEQVVCRDFIHFPLKSNGILFIKAAHNIIDGITLISIGIGLTYLL